MNVYKPMFYDCNDVPYAGTFLIQASIKEEAVKVANNFLHNLGKDAVYYISTPGSWEVKYVTEILFKAGIGI